jgi:hypothetical protein
MTGSTGKNASKVLLLLAGMGLNLAACESQPELLEPAPSTDGQIVIDVTPEGLDAPWSLELPSGLELTGYGDAELANMAPSAAYTLVWGPVDGLASPTPNPTTQPLIQRGLIRFTGTYTQIVEPTGTIEIDPNPNSLSAPWSLSGPAGFMTNGEGDAVLAGRQVGEYTLTWGDTPGYITPTPNPWVFTLGADQTTSRTGLYVEDPIGTGPPAGTIVISTFPQREDFPWSLSGPGGFNRSGTGDATYADVDLGLYTVTWGDRSGWITPSPSSEAHDLQDDEVKNFVGSWGDPSSPVISGVSGSATNGGTVQISGSDFGSHTLDIASGVGPDGWIESNGAGTGFDNLSGATNWDVGVSTPIPAIISTEQAHSGSNSVLARIVRSQGHWQSVMRYTHPNPFDEIWVSFWYWFDPIHTSTDPRTNYSANKWFRVGDADVNNTCAEIYTGARWTGDRPGASNVLIFCGQVPGSSLWDWDTCYESIYDEESNEPLCTSCACGQSGPNVGDCAGESAADNLPTPREWTRVVVRAKPSDFNIANGEFFYSVNKPERVEEVAVDWSGILTHSSGCTRFSVEPWQHFQFQNYFDDNYGSDMGQRADFFYDDIYIQFGTQARVEIGNDPNYDRCTLLETQVPTQWSTSGITVKVNHGSFTPGSTVYMFVVRQDGSRSAGRSVTLQ